MKATANEKFCPSIRDKVEGTEIPKGVKAVYELAINGLMRMLRYRSIYRSS
jgi:formylmethanofuran--tetrahydromethanopterin N-formyltransferase